MRASNMYVNLSRACFIYIAEEALREAVGEKALAPTPATAEEVALKDAAKAGDDATVYSRARIIGNLETMHD